MEALFPCEQRNEELHRQGETCQAICQTHKTGGAGMVFHVGVQLFVGMPLFMHVPVK